MRSLNEAVDECLTSAWHKRKVDAIDVEKKKIEIRWDRHNNKEMVRGRFEKIRVIHAYEHDTLPTYVHMYHRNWDFKEKGGSVLPSTLQLKGYKFDSHRKIFIPFIYLFIYIILF